MAVCGRTAGKTSEIDTSGLFLDHKRIVGSTMGTQRDLDRLIDLVADGALTPAIEETYSLEETSAAFAEMQNRDGVGKFVVTP